MEKNLNGRLLQQIAASPTAFHAVDTARRALSAECPIICFIADSTAHFVGKIDLVPLPLQKADISTFKFGMYFH